MSEVRDDDGFTAFAVAIRPRLQHDAYRLCGDWHEAEDLVQTTLHKLYRRWDRLSRHRELAGYARQTLAHTFYSEHRRLRWTHEVASAEPPEIRAADDPTADRLTLVDAMRTLGPRQRAVVVLRFWVDLSVEQTAVALGCSPGTVTSQTSRALHTLREALSGLGSRRQVAHEVRPG